MSGVALEEMDDQTLDRVIRVIHRFTGITISPGKKAMLEGRLFPRMKKLGISSFKSYLDYLETHLEEKPLFIDQVTTNETYFFRTPRIWEYLEKEYLVAWFSKNPGTTFHVWSAAASSGEEAHTLGLVLQHFREKHPSFQYQVTGTDISRDILDHAERGVYSGRSIETLRKHRPELFHKYLKEGNPGEYSATQEIRSRIKFSLHNLFEKPKFNSPFDLVLIRNVLIYFQARDQEKVLSNVGMAMKPDTVLIIGESESLNHLSTRFTYKAPLIYTLVSESKQLESKEAA